MSESKTDPAGLQNEPPIETEALRPHVFDGTIQEYDKRLPNWWLWTLYGAIIFSIVYWVAFSAFKFEADPGRKVTEEIEEEKKIAARNSGVITNETLRQMTHESDIVKAGESTFITTCAACHQPDLSGKIGPSLIKETWLHGGEPLDIVNTITTGVPAKGMPTWGPILGKQKIIEVAAFIVSKQTSPPKRASIPDAAAAASH